MRIIFSVPGLVLALVIVGGLVKKQLDTVMPWAAASGAGTELNLPVTPPGAALVQQQIKQLVESSIQHSHPMPKEP